jgi:hypothetical protein
VCDADDAQALPEDGSEGFHDVYRDLLREVHRALAPDAAEDDDIGAGADAGIAVGSVRCTPGHHGSAVLYGFHCRDSPRGDGQPGSSRPPAWRRRMGPARARCSGWPLKYEE